MPEHRQSACLRPLNGRGRFFAFEMDDLREKLCRTNDIIPMN